MYLVACFVSIFRQNVTHCISHYAIVVCVCVCVRACVRARVRVCVCRICVPRENGLRYRRHFVLIARISTGHNLQEFDTNLTTNSKMADKMAAMKHYNWLYLSNLLLQRLNFFNELCIRTPDISCRSLTQIGLQIPRWRTKWRSCKAMAVFQALIFHFKCILHFAVYQLLCWPVLLQICYKTHLRWCFSLNDGKDIESNKQACERCGSFTL